MNEYIQILLAEQNYTKAEALAQKALILNPTAKNHINLAKVYIASEKFELANQTLIKAHEKFPDNDPIQELMDSLNDPN